MFKVLDKDFNPLVVTTDAYNTLVDKEVNNGNIFKFNLPQNSPNAQYISEANYIEVEGQLYYIESYVASREVTRTINVTCNHVFFLLEKEYWENDFEVVDTIDWQPHTKMIFAEFYTYTNPENNIKTTYQCIEEHTSGATFEPYRFRDVSHLQNNYQPATTPKALLELLFFNTPFKVGKCYEEFVPTDFKIERGDLMKNVKKIQETWGGEWLIDNFTIGLVDKIGKDKGVSFEYAKNNVKISKDIDIRDVITRLYVYGKNGLTLASVNEGKPYLDAPSDIFNKYSRPRIGEVSFDEEDINRLLTKGKEHLESVQNSTINYNLSVAELKHLSGLEDIESFDLGDVVTVRDKELLGEEVKTRIMNYSYNPFKYSEASTITLNNKQKTLLTIFNEIKEEIKDTKEELEQKIEDIANTPRVINSIVEVTQQQIINTETVHALNAWIKNIYVDYLETDFWGKDARNKVASIERNFITIKEQDIKFISQDLDLNEVEDLLIPNPDPIVGGLIPVYYTAIGEHPDAYRYFTVTAPSVVYKEVIPNSPEEQAFKVKVYKKQKEVTKMIIRFKEDTNEPYIQFGSGLEGKEPWETNAKAFITKWEDQEGYMGLNIEYYSKDNKVRRLRLDDNGIFVDIQSPEPQFKQVRNIFTADFSPTPDAGADGDIWFVR